MLAYFSFVDVLNIPEIKEIASNPFDLLPRKMDNVVAPYLWKLGMDVDRGIKVQACRHRIVDLKPVVSYRYVGLERSDKEWLANRNCSMSARIQAQEDKEVASDMVRMSLEGIGEKGFRSMCEKASGQEGTTRTIKKEEEDDWQDNVSVMRALRDIQIAVRGNLHPDEEMFESREEAESNFETQIVQQ